MSEPAAAVELRRVPGARRRGGLSLVPLALGGATLVALLAVVPLAVVAHQFTASDVLPVLITLPFAAVGLGVAQRQQRNPIGWILLVLALIVTVGGDAGFYALRAYRVDHHPLPLSRLAVALAPGWIALLVLLPLPILLFPDGRLPTRFWRGTLWLYLLVAALFCFWVGVTDLGAFTDRTIRVDATGELASLGNSSSPSPVAAVAEKALFLAYAVLGLACVARQLLRYRRVRGIERQQLKWLISGGAIGIIGFSEALALDNAHALVWQIVSAAGYMGVAALPLGIGVGILRYRLYEIDRLLSRTISYALVSGLLGAVFGVSILLTTRALPLSSTVGVAASTLAVAALFTPVRRGMQRVVDRRFNRSRYDAEQALDAFSARLRDAVEVETVRSELLATIDRAIAPAHASLWLSNSSPPGGRG